MAQVQLVVDAETAKGIRALVSYAKAQDRIEQSTGKAANAATRQARETNAVAAAADKAGRDLLKMTGGFLSAQGIISGLGKVRQALEDITEAEARWGRQQADLGAASIALRELNRGVPNVTEIATKYAVPYGVKANPALRVTQAVQSAGQLDLEQALEEAGHVYTLMNRGMEESRAIEIVQRFLVGGLSGADATRSVQISGEKSNLNTAQIGGAATALSSFSEKDAASVFPMAAGISRFTTNTEVPTATKILGESLNIPNTFNEFLSNQLKASALKALGKTEEEIAEKLELGDSKGAVDDVKRMLALPDVRKKYGTDYTDLGAVQKLEMIREIIPEATGTDTAKIAAALKKYGLEDRGAIRAMSGMLEDRTFATVTTDTIPSIQRAPKDYVSQLNRTDESEDLAFAKQMAMQRDQGNFEMQRIFDPKTATRDLELREAGQRLSQGGSFLRTNFVHQEGEKQGETGWWGKLISDVFLTPDKMDPEFQKRVRDTMVMTEMGPMSPALLNRPPQVKETPREALNAINTNTSQSFVANATPTGAFNLSAPISPSAGVGAQPPAFVGAEQPPPSWLNGLQSSIQSLINTIANNTAATETNSETAIAISQTRGGGGREPVPKISRQPIE